MDIIRIAIMATFVGSVVLIAWKYKKYAMAIAAFIAGAIIVSTMM